MMVFLFVAAISELSSISHQGDSAPVDTISVTGTGDVTVIPNIATFSFSVTETATTVLAAQKSATDKTNAAIAALEKAGVANKDIQTDSYNINPHYEYQNAVCPQSAVYNSSGSSDGSGSVSGSDGAAIPTIATAPTVSSSLPATPIYCPAGKSVLTGYDVSETIDVKVRDITQAGTLFADVGSLGVQNVNDLAFSVDNQEAVQEQARDLAIMDAKSQADKLASELGVHIVRVVNFTDNAGNYAYPVMAMAAKINDTSASTPEIPAGQQKITDTVSVTYQIR